MRTIIFLFILSFSVFALGDEEDEIKLGKECDFQDSSCESIEHAFCNDDDTCECEEGYLASPNNSVCLPLAKKAGDECEIVQQCSAIPSAECLDKACTVVPASTTPPPTVKPKVECTEDSQCSSFLVSRVCKNGTCVIAIPSISPKSLGLDALVLGRPCQDDTECSGEGMACTDKLCKCIDNFVPAQNLKNCLPKAKSIGDKCVETAQCLALNGSICESEKCSEKVTKILKDIAEKIPSLLIGNTCQTDNECEHLTHALCTENVCQCKDGYVTSVASNSCLEKAKKEGDPCEIDKQCEDIKGATCLKNKCVKPAVPATKLGKQNSGSAKTVSKLILGTVLFTKMLFI